MAQLPKRSARQVIRMTNAQLAHPELRMIMLFMVEVIIIHFSFVGLLVFNDYIISNWTVEVLPFVPKAHGDYMLWVWVAYVGAPVILFIYELFELWSLMKLYRNRKQVRGDRRIRINLKVLSGLHIANSLSLLLLIMACVMVVVLEDKFVSHMVVLVSWAIYIFLKIGAIISPRT